MSRASLLRLWWAAPGALVAGSAIGAAIVVGPTLGEQVSLPRELPVGTTGSNAPVVTKAPARHVPAHRPPPVRPTATPLTPSPAPVTSARVVAPHRQVVTEPAESERSDPSGSREHEGGDG